MKHLSLFLASAAITAPWHALFPPAVVIAVRAAAVVLSVALFVRAFRADS